MEYTIEKISEAFKVIEDALSEKLKELDQANRVAVERLTQLDGYVLKDPVGVIGLLYAGDNFTKRDDYRGNKIFMKREMLISVVPIIRFIDSPRISVEHYKMIPADYVDFVLGAVAGIEVFNKRPGYENKIYPVASSLAEEANGVWKYPVTFGVPLDYAEEDLRT